MAKSGRRPLLTEDLYDSIMEERAHKSEPTFKDFIWQGEPYGQSPWGIGSWVRVRMLYEYLRPLDWTRSAVAECLHANIQRLAATGKPTLSQLNALTGNVFDEPAFNELSSHASIIRAALVRIGEEKFAGRASLDLGDRAFLKAYFATPADLRRTIQDRVKTQRKTNAASVEHSRRSKATELNDLLAVPDFAATGVEPQQDTLNKLLNFTKTSDGPKVFTIAGHAATGKSGLFKALYRSIKCADENSNLENIIYIDFSKTRSFEGIVDKLNEVLGIISNSSGVIIGGGRNEIHTTQPMELKLQLLASNLKSVVKDALLIITNIDAFVSDQRNGASFFFGDERFNRLLSILRNAKNNLKIALGIVPQGSSHLYHGGMHVDAFLEAPGINYLPSFLNAFAPEGADQVALRKRLLRLLLEANTITPVKSTVIMASITLLATSHAEGREQEKWSDQNDDAIREAAKSQRANPILRKILDLHKASAIDLIILTFIALNERGVLEETLAKLLRYHRQFFEDFHQLPVDAKERGREKLAEFDLKLIRKVCAGLGSLIGRVEEEKSAPKKEGGDDEEQPSDPIIRLHITTGLREPLLEELESGFSSITCQVHRILARERRRDAMRIRLARKVAGNRGLESLRNDFGAASHLLASVKLSGDGRREITGSPASQSPTELAVFTGQSVPPPAITHFVLHEILKKDAGLGDFYSYSDGWIPDEAIVDMLLGFFHLGRSGPKVRPASLDVLQSIPDALQANLPPDDIAWIVASLGDAAWRLQDLELLWQLLALEPSVQDLGAAEASLEKLQLLRLDTLIALGRLRQPPDVAEAPSEYAEEVGMKLIQKYGGLEGLAKDCKSPEERILEAKARAQRATLSVGDSRRLRMRAQILFRLAEICDLTGDDHRCLLYFLEADTIGNFVDGPHPILSGTPGRKFLRALLRLAERSRNTSPEDFCWAKITAEEVHRRNVRRLTSYPSERTAIRIDEALLERHIRGDAGRGNHELSYEILAGEGEDLIALGAPRDVRLEHFLEKANACNLMAAHDPDAAAFYKDEALASIEHIDDVFKTFYIRPSGQRPHTASGIVLQPAYMFCESKRLRAEVEDDDSQDEVIRNYFEFSSFRLKQLVDCVSVGSYPELSWALDPNLP